MKIKELSLVTKLFFATLLGLSILAGCESPSIIRADASGVVTASPGARLWEQSCVRCHNLRLPNSYSDQDWGIIAHHMRLRANLTGEEHRAILAFLRNGF